MIAHFLIPQMGRDRKSDLRSQPESAVRTAVGKCAYGKMIKFLEFLEFANLVAKKSFVL